MNTNLYAVIIKSVKHADEFSTSNAMASAPPPFLHLKWQKNMQE